MILAGICGALLLAAFAAFLVNIVMTVGLKGRWHLPALGARPKVLLPETNG